MTKRRAEISRRRATVVNHVIFGMLFLSPTFLFVVLDKTFGIYGKIGMNEPM